MGGHGGSGMAMHTTGHASGHFGHHNGRFFRDHRFFVVSGFVGIAYPWWYLDDYYFYPNAYADYDSGPMYDRQYWTDLALAVQSDLARLGYYHGPINGTLDRSSRNAIRAFQAAHRLPVNGILTPKLFRALGIDYGTA
jgi:Putative peptidoglycan binding domain